MKEPKMGGFEHLEQLCHRLLESVGRRCRFNCGTMTRDRTLPIMSEEFRFVELGFESLENTLKHFMFRFVCQARLMAKGSIHIHTPMMRNRS
jgi:hypothetical protein